MTDTLSPALPPSIDRDKPGSSPPGAFERLSAFDGLFLRSEHLNLMEDYAASLALAVGAASGPGVVYGFEVTLSGQVLSVSPGLAIMADGRPVRTTGVLTAGIDELSLSAGAYYRIGLMSGTWPHGEEAVQGLLCDSGCECDGDSSHSSRLSEGPFVKIARADDAGLAAQTASHRSWLASALFREEESLARRWPATEHAVPNHWPPNGQGPPVDMLPLAVLVPPLGNVDWQVDAWAARRDRGAPPPMRHWEWRLGMRPRDVFLAQVLQFQAQLADIEQSQTAGPPAAALRKTIRELAESGELAKVLAFQFARSRTEWGAAPGAELVELPPAGFVRGASGSLASVRESVEAYLACPGIVRKVCSCSPGDVGELFEAAQHRDRTRTPRSEDFRDDDTGTIDVYVPMRGREPAYDWVLFTRAQEVKCPEPAPPAPATDKVDVIYSAFDPAAAKSTETTLGSLEYPEATWAVPEDGGDVFAQVQTIARQAEGLFTLHAQVTTDERRPLGYLRAALLAGPFADGQASTTPSVETSVAPDATERVTIETGRSSNEITGRGVGKETSASPAKKAAARSARKATTPRRKPATPSGGAGDEH